LSRQQATNLTMIMGGVYLAYSAYFLSIDFDTIYMIMNICLLLLYLILGITYLRNCWENMATCQKFIDEQVLNNEEDDGNEMGVIMVSLSIKMTMLRWIAIGSFGFCLSKCVKYGVLGMIDDDFLQARSNCLIQSLDFIWILMIMIPCHPRKEWPQFFTLSVQDLAGQ